MRNSFFATFASGMQLIIKDILKKQIPDADIRQLFDGAVLFETTLTYDRLNMYCFNNIFALIYYCKSGSIESFIKKIVESGLQSGIISNNSSKYKTFRVITSSENQLVSVNNSLKAKLENLVSSQSQLKLNRSNSDAEFWISCRSEGFCYFIKRLSRHTAYDKILNKGELHPEMAFIMNWFAEADKNDIVLDPFCGSGAIPINRALHFPVKQIYAFDIDKKMIDIVKNRIAKKKSLSGMANIAVKQLDASNLDIEIPCNSISKIVTDPPWGLFENVKMNIAEFYGLIISKMEIVLKHNGIMVLLTGRHIDIESIIQKFPALSLAHNFEVLVSGKKANLVKIIKN